MFDSWLGSLREIDQGSEVTESLLFHVVELYSVGELGVWIHHDSSKQHWIHWHGQATQWIRLVTIGLLLIKTHPKPQTGVSWRKLTQKLARTMTCWFVGPSNGSSLEAPCQPMDILVCFDFSHHFHHFPHFKETVDRISINISSHIDHGKDHEGQELNYSIILLIYANLVAWNIWIIFP